MTYTGPAGFVMTRDEALMMWRELVHCNDVAVRDLRQRLRVYLESDWRTGDPTRDVAEPIWNTPKRNANA